MKKTTRNKWLVFALLLLGFQSTQAQTEYRLNVKEAVDLALNNVADIKNLRIDSLKQEAQNKEIVGSALPQVTGSGQVAHYLTLPKILFPSAGKTDVYTVLNQEGVKDGSGNTIQPKNEFTVQEFSFVQPWSITAGVSLNQLLFQPDVFVGLIARKTSIEYAKEKNAKVFGIVGRDGGFTKKAGDNVVVVPVVDEKLVTPHSEAFQAVVWHCLVSHPLLQIQATKW